MRTRVSITLLSLVSMLPCVAAVPLETGKSNKEETQCTEKAETKAAESRQQRFLPVEVAGMQVFVDAETGRLREPTERERLELSRALLERYGNRESEPEHQPVIRKNGTMSMVLGMNYLNFSVARVAADGTLVHDCVAGMEAADKVLAQPANARKAKEE